MAGSIETEHNGDNYGDSSGNTKATGHVYRWPLYCYEFHPATETGRIIKIIYLTSNFSVFRFPEGIIYSRV